MRPAVGVAQLRDFIIPQRRAVRLGAVLFGRAEADVGLAVDQRGLLRLLRLGQRAVDVFGIVAVAGENLPARRLEAALLVGDVRHRNLAVDRDVVVVPKNDQLRQLLTARKPDGFLADAFHEAAVTGDDVGVVILHLAAETRAQHFFGHGHAHGGRKTLTQRAGRRFDALGVTVFRVAGGLGAPLAEILDLVDRHVGVAGQVQKTVDQHRAVACREDEPVTVGPVGARGIEFQVLFEQHGRHVGHAHRHAGVTGVRRLDGIHGKHPQGGGFHPVVRVFFAKGGNVHVGHPLLVVSAVRLS